MHFRYLMPFELYLRSFKRHGKEAFCRILGCVLFDGISFAEYLSATELPLRRKLQGRRCVSQGWDFKCCWVTTQKSRATFSNQTRSSLASDQTNDVIPELFPAKKSTFNFFEFWLVHHDVLLSRLVNWNMLWTKRKNIYIYIYTHKRNRWLGIIKVSCRKKSVYYLFNRHSVYPGQFPEPFYWATRPTTNPDATENLRFAKRRWW